MKITLKEFLNIADGRLWTDIGDVYKVLDYVFDSVTLTHEISNRMKILNEVCPDWYRKGLYSVSIIKTEAGSEDFDKMQEIVNKDYKNYCLEIEKLKL